MRFTTCLLALALSSLSPPSTLVSAQTPDGLIVPFTKLPLCAATCGKLWDVQGRCAPAAPVDDAKKSCFCSAAELQPFSVGGPAGDCCASDVQGDLQLVKNWFDGFCAVSFIPRGPLDGNIIQDAVEKEIWGTCC